MKGPEAKLLYGHVLDELGKGLPGGKDKVKGKRLSLVMLNQRWSIWSDDASGHIKRRMSDNQVSLMQGPVTILLDTKKE
jgi:hypothetical protein